MHAVKLNATVGADHRIELELPAEIPAGPIEIIILADAMNQVAEGGTLKDFFDEVDRSSHRRLSKADIDRAIADERSSWE